MITTNFDKIFEISGLVKWTWCNTFFWNSSRSENKNIVCDGCICENSPSLSDKILEGKFKILVHAGWVKKIRILSIDSFFDFIPFLKVQIQIMSYLGSSLWNAYLVIWVSFQFSILKSCAFFLFIGKLRWCENT